MRTYIDTIYNGKECYTVGSGGWEKTTLIVLEKDEFYDELWRLFWQLIVENNSTYYSKFRLQM